MTKKIPYQVPAVDRTLDILEYLGRNQQASLTQIYQDLDLAKSTTYGILLTLENRGYVRKDVSGRFQLGLKLYELGTMAVRHVDFVKEALPIMEDLAQKTGLTCNLGVLEGDAGVYIEKVDAPSPIRLNSWKGKRLSLHCTALGKVLLAYKSLPEIVDVLERIPLVANTEHTITDKETLLNELLQVRRRGYAVDNQENEEDITCVAAPIFNHAGKTVAAVSLSGLTTWLTPEKINNLTEVLLPACEAISKRIGGK